MIAINVATPLLLLLVLLQLHDAQSKVNINEIYQHPLSHGFGDDVDWVKWEDAVETAMERNKPIFLLIHKTWCHACKALKKTFQQSNAKKAFKKLSEYFVMVNTADDDEPYEEEYRPDGKYIPRLLFLDKNGDLLAEFKNKKAEYKNYAYYYSSPADILNSMKDVLKHYGIEVPEMKRGEKLKAARRQKAAEAKANIEKEEAEAKKDAEKNAKAIEEKKKREAEEKKKREAEEKKKREAEEAAVKAKEAKKKEQKAKADAAKDKKDKKKPVEKKSKKDAKVQKDSSAQTTKSKKTDDKKTKKTTKKTDSSSGSGKETKKESKKSKKTEL